MKAETRERNEELRKRYKQLRMEYSLTDSIYILCSEFNLAFEYIQNIVKLKKDKK